MSTFTRNYTRPSYQPTNSHGDLWGTLIDQNNIPSPLFCRLIDAIFFLTDAAADQHARSGRIESSKIRWLWIQSGVFQPQKSQVQDSDIFELYKMSSIPYTVVQDGSQWGIPILDRSGFLHLAVYEARADSNLYHDRCSRLLRSFGIVDPQTNQPFPTIIPRTAFPQVPDPQLAPAYNRFMWRISNPTPVSTYQNPSAPMTQASTMSAYPSSTGPTYQPNPTPMHPPNPTPTYQPNPTPMHSPNPTPTYRPNHTPTYQTNTQLPHHANTAPAYLNNASPSYQPGNGGPPHQAAGTGTRDLGSSASDLTQSLVRGLGSLVNSFASHNNTASRPAHRPMGNHPHQNNTGQSRLMGMGNAGNNNYNSSSNGDQYNSGNNGNDYYNSNSTNNSRGLDDGGDDSYPDNDMSGYDPNQDSAFSSNDDAWAAEDAAAMESASLDDAFACEDSAIF